MSLIDDLNMWQIKVLEAAGCIERTAQVGYSRMPFRFTEDWHAEQARVALAVLPEDNTKVRDNEGTEWTTTNCFADLGDEYAPYNIVVDEAKPEPTFGVCPMESATLEKQTKYETHVMHDGTCYFLPVEEPKPEWTVDSLMAAIREGGDFKAVKEGLEPYYFYSERNPTVTHEHYAHYVLNPANGWKIEEIV